MAERVVIHVESEFLDSEVILSELDLSGCGGIVSFLGITRGVEDGIKVHALEFDAWEERLPEVLNNLVLESIDRFGVLAVAMSHRVGRVGAGEPIVSIHVGSAHRKEAFEACSWLIDSLKKQAPLWKKEIREDGTHWKEGLG